MTPTRAPHPVTLRQLQYVVAVADRRSFRLAAAECHVSQPSLSAQLAQAEASLGVRLFERGRRGVWPTAAGEELVERARSVLALADDLVGSARRLADPLAGRLRIGVIPTVAPYLLPEIGPKIRDRFRKLRLSWHEDKTGPLLEAMTNGEIDAAVLASDDAVAKLPHRVVGRDPFVVAVAPDHPLAGRTGGVSEEDLAGERILLLDDGHCFRDQALAICLRSGSAEAAYRGTSLATLVQMAAGGEGATLLPQLSVPVENRRASLRILPFRGDGPGRVLVLAWRAGVGLESTTAPVAEAIGEILAGARADGRPERAW